LEELQRLGYHFVQIGNKVAALLCLDHIFATDPPLQGQTMDALTTSLEIFFVYANLLRDFASLSDPCGSHLVQKLFALDCSKDGKFSITAGTFLHPEMAPSSDTQTVSRRKLVGLFKRSLCEHLRRVVLRENKAFLATQSISPCLAALVTTSNESNCHRSHVNKAILNLDWYNTKIRVHLQQVLIFQTLHPIEPGSEETAQQMYVRPYLHRTIKLTVSWQTLI